MKIDFWRALGVGSVSILAFLVASLVVYAGDYSLETADYIMLPVSALILVVVSVIYYRVSPVAPSVESGFLLALVMLGYNFLTGFLSGMLAAVQEYPAPEMPEVSLTIILLGLAVGIAAPTLTGWYLGKNN